MPEQSEMYKKNVNKIFFYFPLSLFAVLHLRFVREFYV